VISKERVEQIIEQEQCSPQWGRREAGEDVAQLFMIRGDLKILLGKAETITMLSEDELRRLILAKAKMLAYQRDSMVYAMGYRGNH
jgi:hypothetical protein